ncbi:hypothetical protein HNR46_003404 [Haloferula luteola]|uniref:Uncharacterized protein n=1 Tax=Haloferula luteola TaxID=595692 RepID=A0A840VH36_9BACT|nr:DUF5695 domain-containing protein [Haloferula luteola]MBB5353150.1 hypothetical protein [Haloferula luteola]
MTVLPSLRSISAPTLATLFAISITRAAIADDTSVAESGAITKTTPAFEISFLESSQTLASLQPKGAGGFDFTPADWLKRRSADGFHHLGDLTFQVRVGRQPNWQSFDTAAHRRPVQALPTNDAILAAADLAATLPEDCPVKITRTWSLDENKHLTLRFQIENPGEETLEIGALGIPMVFNNIISERSLEQAHAICSFADPSISQDAGYLQVTRLSGEGPVLLVVPEKDTPFEAYVPLDEPMPRAQTFEGMLSWEVHTRALAEQKWNGIRPWNPPSSAELKPGESRTYGLKFLLAPESRRIEDTLIQNDRPVAVGIPGYILPMDLDARLFVKSPLDIQSIQVDPANALTIHRDPPTAQGWKAFTLHGKSWGRSRLTLTYSDGSSQVVHYLVTKPAAEAVSDLGNFLTTHQWFVDPNDPFHRSPSVISYDREANRQLDQESRVWIAGLGDEGGAGAWLSAMMKILGQPDPEEVTKLETFVNQVLWGTLQNSDGPQKYGVRKSAFFYQPDAVPGFTYDSDTNWTTWTSWDKKHSEDVGRGYNYPHTVAAYWAMYRIARNHPDLVSTHDWTWYLNQAFATMDFAFGRNAEGHRHVGYVELGLMEGTVFLRVLEDLQREGWTEKAERIETLMKERADRWKGEQYPFGSEMAWDSTGQEEVYAWCDYFGYDEKAQVSLNSILAYMPTVPHWGYNGNARRYWDFLYGGKLSRIERQIHHYGSSLNAIPVLSEYREHPDDLYLLRVGYAGTMAPLSNIDREGFASAAFHSFPDTLKWDAYSGDYGPAFFGHAIDTATYLIQHPEFGWQAFGGNLSESDGWVHLQPKDSFRMRVYLAPLGLWLTLDAGAFESVEFQPTTGIVKLTVTPGTVPTSKARLCIEQPAQLDGVGAYSPTTELPLENGAYTIDLSSPQATLELKAASPEH